MTTPEPMSPITEDDIADYLVNTPDFFERHASLLATVQLTHPQSHRTVGLQERQAQMLRDKIKGLEHRIMDMMRHGNENMLLTDKLHRWSCELLVTPHDQLADSAVDNIRDLFQVPQVALRLWSLQGVHAQAAYAQGVTRSCAGACHITGQTYRWAELRLRSSAVVGRTHAGGFFGAAGFACGTGSTRFWPAGAGLT